MTDVVSRKQVVKKSSLVLATKVLAAAIGFFVTWLITQQLDVASAGEVFYFITFITIVSTVARRGADNLILKRLSGETGEGLLVEFLKIVHLTAKPSMVVGVLLLLFSMLKPDVRFEQHAGTYATLLIVAIVLTNIQTIIMHCFQATQRLPYYCYSQLLSRLLFVICLAFTFYLAFKPGKMNIIFLYTATLCISVMSLGYIWLNQINFKHRQSTSNIELKYTSAELRQANTFWLASTMSILLQQGGVLLIGLFSTSDQVALFSTAFRFSLILSFILLAINNVLAPNFAKLKKEGRSAEIGKLYRDSVLLMSLCCFPILCAIYIFADELVSIFGAQYLEAAKLLRVLVIAQAVKVLVGSVGQLLNMTGYEKLQTNTIVVSVLLLVTLCYILVPSLGAMGAALATSVAVIVNNVLGLIFVATKTPYIINRGK